MFRLKHNSFCIISIFWCSCDVLINFWYLGQLNSLSVEWITYFFNFFSDVSSVPKYDNINWSSWSIWILILIICNMHKWFSFSLSKNQPSKSHDFFLFHYPWYMCNINSVTIIGIINQTSLLFLISTSGTFSAISFDKLSFDIFKHIFSHC